MREINHLSIHEWPRSAIPDSQQPTSPIGFLFLKLPPPPCAVLLVYKYILLKSTTYPTISALPINILFPLLIYQLAWVIAKSCARSSWCRMCSIYQWGNQIYRCGKAPNRCSDGDRHLHTVIGIKYHCHHHSWYLQKRWLMVVWWWWICFSWC